MNRTLTDDAFDRELSRFLEVRAEELALSPAPASAVGTPISDRTSSLRLGWRGVLVVTAVLMVGVLIAAAVAGALRHEGRGPITAIPTALAWAPDGSMLAFTVVVEWRASSAPAGELPRRLLETWVVARDGTDLRRLNRDALPPGTTWTGGPLLWSADGLHLAYSRAPGLTNAAGDQLAIQLVTGSGGRVEIAGSPVGWSASNGRLLVNRSVGSGSDIFTVTPEKPGIRQLTSSHDATASGWSPDGSQILYQTTSGTGSGPLASTWVMAADGSAQRRLGGFGDASWSPNGRAISYLTGSPGDLRSVALDGTDDRLLATGVIPGGWAWAPDGSGVVMSSELGLSIGRPGGLRTGLTSDPRDSAPSWSPDGMSIAFSGTRSGGTGLFVIPASGGAPRLVGGGALVDAGYAWQPSAPERLTFVRDFGIQEVDADGSGAATLVPGTAIGDSNGDAIGDVGFQELMTIDANGPDRAVYRVRMAPAFKFIIRNLTDVPWVLSLEGLDVFPSDCSGLEGAMVLVSSREPLPGSAGSLATPPDYCLIPPRATVLITKQLATAGAYVAQVGRANGQGAYGLQDGSYSVVLDFEPSTP